ncbi:MAG: phospholipase effector Tle1 domain-containing protein, partial [Pseudomonadota bacterium]
MAHIVVCADGTWNRPEEDLDNDFPTNVLKLARAVTPQAEAIKQHVFYDWGLGSYHNSLSAGATGVGLHKNILDGYRYIVQNYAPGDRIYLFGFSRGAYTVRALSGLINNCGILKRSAARLITYAWKMYKNPKPDYHPDGKTARTFRAQYSYEQRNVHFIG